MSTRSASPTTASRFSPNRLRGWISPTSSRQPEARGGGRALQQTSRTPDRARRRFRTIPFKLDDAAPLVVARSKKPPRKSPDAKPHDHDHRERLRKRFDDASPAALADYELLALFLFRAIPRQDTKPLGKALLQRFGTLDAVLAAPVQRICEVKGAGGAVAQELKIVQAMLERASKAEFKQRPVISSWSALVNYCRMSMAHEPREQFRVLFLDAKNRLIADDVMNQGAVDHAPVYPREVPRRALELSAVAVILVHNYPSGDPNPAPPTSPSPARSSPPPAPSA